MQQKVFMVRLWGHNRWRTVAGGESLATFPGSQDLCLKNPR